MIKRKNKQTNNISSKLSLLSIGAAAIVTAATFIYINAKEVDASPPDSSYTLVWSDEFNGDSLDMNSWDYQSGGWGDSIQSCYKYGDNNVAVNGGTLKITAKHEPGTRCTGGQDFTSGFVQTKGKKYWKYGYFEARVKMPTHNGSTWPAFWLSPNETVYGSWPKSGEIDVFEGKGHDSTYIAGNAHWWHNGRRKQIPKIFRLNENNNVGNWHTYAVKWQEDKLEFFIDGQRYHTINKFYDGVEDGDPWPFNIPFYIRLNVAIGGTYLTAPHNDANNNIAHFPATMEVDYVRVYQKTNSSTTPTNPTNPTTPTNPSQPGGSSGQSGGSGSGSGSSNQTGGSTGSTSSGSQNQSGSRSNSGSSGSSSGSSTSSGNSSTGSDDQTDNSENSDTDSNTTSGETLQSGDKESSTSSTKSTSNKKFNPLFIAIPLILVITASITAFVVYKKRHRK